MNKVLNKFITMLILITMALEIILPKTLYAVIMDKENGFTPTESGSYQVNAQQVSGGNMSVGINSAVDEEFYKSIYYIENGEKKYITVAEGSTSIYLEAGKTYYSDNQKNNFNYDVVTKKNRDDASLIEALITKVLMFIGSCLYGIVCLAIGESFSIEKVIFNRYGNTKLAFFSGSGENPFIENSGIKSVLNEFFDFFSGIAIAVYLIILVYMAIRIMLSATADKKSKYKQLILYWVEGVIILFLFPYIMKYAISFNNSFVSFIDANKSQYLIEMPVMDYSEDEGLKGVENLVKKNARIMKTKTDFMSVMYNQALDTGWLVYAICWYVMFFQMIGFLIVYFKRVLILIFLIAVFPLVMISYAIDKIGDAKSQAFGSWLKEFLLNVFLQSFHVIAYVLIMSVICEMMDNPSENWLLILIAISFISKGDDILRAIFSLKGSANTVRGIGATILQTAALTKLSGNVKKATGKLLGQSSASRRMFNAFGNLNQRRWDERENRAQAEAARLAQNDIPPIVDLSMPQTNAEIEQDMRNAINKLLNKNNQSTDEEIRRAADKLIGYMNSSNNDVKALLDKLAGELTPDQRALLDSLLEQNAAANGLMVGGREVNINDNIKIIIKRLKRDSNGNLTKESKALLDKVAVSEDDLMAMQVLGAVKFNKDRVKESKNSYTKRTPRRSSRGTRIQGRGAARNRTGRDGLKNSLEYGMYNKVSNSTTKKKFSSEPTKTPQTSIETAMSKTTKSVASNSATSSKRKLNRPKSPWQNVESLAGSKGLETAKYGAEAKYKGSKNDNTKSFVTTSRAEKKRDGLDKVIRYKVVSKVAGNQNTSSGTTNYGNKIPDKKGISASPDTTPHTVRELKQAKEEAQREMRAQKNNHENIDPRNSTAFKINRNEAKKDVQSIKESNSRVNQSNNTKHNIGAEIANKSGSADELNNVLSKSLYVSMANEILTDVFDENARYERFLNKELNEKNDANIKSPLESGRDREELYKGKSFSREADNDFRSAIKYIDILNSANTGKYTAEELLNNIKSLKDIIGKYENGNIDERIAMEDIMKSLGCRLEDFESYVRVKILNDPSSVGNDKKILEDSKEYVKNTQIPNAIKDRLAYDINTLQAGKDLRYERTRDTEYAGIVSENQKTRAQKEYEDKLKYYELQKQIDKLDVEAKDEYNMKKYGSDIGDIAKNALEFGVDLSFSAAGSIGTGFVTTGFATNGKEESFIQAPTNFLMGYSIANDTYETAKGTVLGIGKDLFGSDDKKKDKKTPLPEREKVVDPIEYYKDKTKIDTKSLFSNRLKKD